MQSAWKKVVREMCKIPDWEKIKKTPTQYQKVVSSRELLWTCRSLLEKIESGENETFNFLIFKKTMNFYHEQMKQYE